ncbi:MAG TPA: hypothetical protein VGI40_17520 [Pirellulaceae bacterium]
MNEPAPKISPLPRLPPEPIYSKRLRIADLLLITLGTAIAIWILQPPRGPRHIGFVTVSVVMAPLYGCAVAAVLVSAFRMFTNTGTFATEPGHWLLLILGTIFLGIGLLISGALHLSVELPSEVARGGYAILFLLGIALLMTSVFVIALATGTNEDETVYWKFVLRMIVWALVLEFVIWLLLVARGPELLLLVLGPPLVLMAAFVAAAVNDLRQRNYRDFWHWLGVAAFAGLPIHVVLLIIAALFGG